MTKKLIRPRGIGPLPVPPKHKKRQNVPPHIAHLECSICGEPLAGKDGSGMVYQTRQRDQVCEYCFAAANDLLKALGIDPDSNRGNSAFDALFRLLSRTGHKARVRVKQHEDRKHSFGPADHALGLDRPVTTWYKVVMAETFDTVVSTPVLQAPIQCAIPELCVVMLVGASASGKSTFARKWFKPTEILSSDAFRGMVGDDENDQTVTKDAFELLYATAEKRLRRGKLVVFDATNVQPFAIEHIMRMARDHFVRVVAFAFGLPLQECLINNAARERKVDEAIIRRHVSQFYHVMRDLRRRYKGVRNVWTFNSNVEATAANITRTRSRHYKHFEDGGPFDVIGDVHGCFDELLDLVAKLGYEMKIPAPAGGESAAGGEPSERFARPVHPQGRKLVFVGDYIDRGPYSYAVLHMIQQLSAEGLAICLPGNHDVRLVRKLRKATPEELLKNPSKLTHGLQATLESFQQGWGTIPPATPEDLKRIIEWINDLPSHLILDHGKLVVSHAGLREEMIGRSHGAVREFCLYSNPTGAVDEDGFPIREDWAKNYRGKAIVAYGHVHAGMAEFYNNTICLDTNVYMGGTLTALRYPEREIVSVPARKIYFTQTRSEPAAGVPPAPGEQRVHIGDPLIAEGRKEADALLASIGALVSSTTANILAAAEMALEVPSPGAGVTPSNDPSDVLARLASRQLSERTGRELQALTPPETLPPTDLDDLVDIADLVEKRRVDTRLIGPVSFSREMAAAALEQTSRFAVDPRWLIYLPPTMSPCEAAPEGDFLERPEEAFAYYRERNVSWVVCEEKHMGSRLIAVVCRDEQTAFERFGVRSSVGACYTRLGRPFFSKPELETGVLNGIRDSMDRAGLWEKLKTNWICLDCELMPWSAKAEGLLYRLYGSAGRAGRMALDAEASTLINAAQRGDYSGAGSLLEADRAKVAEMAVRWSEREQLVNRYVEAYRRYCWATDGMKGLKLAPFHVMATEGQVHTDKTNLWHMAVGYALAQGSDLLVSSPFRLVDLSSEEMPGVRVPPHLLCRDDLSKALPLESEIAGNFQPSKQEEEDLRDFLGGWKIATGTRWWQLPPHEAVKWWHEMTTRMIEGSDLAVANVEGMVVKPLNFMPPVDERFGRVQPALKCRGREYLRIIYGPEYTAQLEKLRKRGLGSKRRLAVQEFALGIEGLERFVQRKPLARVHECAFAVLALECEPLDPRL